MRFIYIPIILFGIALVVIITFIAKKLFSPKKIATLANLVKQKKFAAAIRLAKQMLAKDSRNPEVHYLLGISYREDGKTELALMEFKSVNQISQFGGICPEGVFRRTIASLYAEYNQPEEALKEYLLLMKLEPEVSENYFQAGLLFEQRDNTDRAINFYRKAIEIDSRNSDAHYQLGFLLYKTKHHVEAKEELDLAINTREDNYKAYYYLGKLLKESHDYVAALVAFEKAQKDPEFKIKSLIERGSCYMSLGDLDKAVTELDRAIRLVKNESSSELLFARYFLSLCYEKLRQFENAISQWEQIYAKKPSFRDVAEKLSQYQDLRNDDKMKDFLTASADEFYDICKTIVESLDLSTNDISDIPNGCQIIAMEQESKWRNARRMPRLIRLLRVADVVDLSAVRSIHEEMKKLSVLRGIIITSSRFSKSAVDFAETRPVDLIDKERLHTILTTSAAINPSKT
ncbi:MAG: tetratricopeptide repeat protein [Spirochaetales bacterium]|jgi:tetratricopeptide (TPR) repeat protein|nr:tetratricopeptide repeat protein [Spirochaetales bacterium]